MDSLKIRLVVTAILLSLLPLAVGTWAYGREVERGELGRTDARLHAGLAALLGITAEETREVTAQARRLARSRAVASALARNDSRALRRLVPDGIDARFITASGRRVGVEPEIPSLQASVRVVGATGQTVGHVIVDRPLDRPRLHSLAAKAGLAENVTVALTRGGRVVVGPQLALGDPLRVMSTTPVFLELRSTTFRALGAAFPTEPATTAVALLPKAALDPVLHAQQQRLLLVGAIMIALIAGLAYGTGRGIVGRVRELGEAATAIAGGDLQRRAPVRGRDELTQLAQRFNEMAAQLETRLQELQAERGRARHAVERFGEALAATHDRHLLWQVVIETVADAAGAAGGKLLVDGRELARVGEVDRGVGELELPLVSGESGEARLVFTPAGIAFTAEQEALAGWLVAQASIALENARLHEQVEQQAVTDALTGLANRRFFEKAMAGELARTERFGGSLALILADLDHFKRVNDAYGHQAGDEVLSAFAQTLSESVRGIDLASRWGGEEFAVLLPQTDLEGAVRVAERIRSALAAQEILLTGGQRLSLTASFGVAAVPGASTQEALVTQADKALYQAKEDGRNCVVASESRPPVVLS